jgi:hypothetical protein
MKTIKPSIAVAELLLIFPAALFMTALFVRQLQPQRFEPAHTAQQIVAWYSGRAHLGLWVLLITLPLIMLSTGFIALLHAWKNNPELRQAARQTLGTIRAHLATVFVAAATLAAGVILSIVALHMITE